MNIPNILSLLRLAMVPAFVVVFFSPSPYHMVYAATIFLMAGLTDIADGFIARRFHLESKLGKILDPMADKTMQAAVFICLYIKGIVPLPLFAMYIAKELFMMGGSIFLLRSRGDIPHSRWYGKVGTILFYIASVVLILFENIHDTVKYILLTVVVLWAICSAAFYFKRAKRAVKEPKG